MIETLFGSEPTKPKRRLPKRYTIPESTPGALCNGKHCGARIYWIAGKNNPHPVNHDGTSHWGTCPDAASFRGTGKGYNQ